MYKKNNKNGALGNYDTSQNDTIIYTLSAEFGGLRKRLVMSPTADTLRKDLTKGCNLFNILVSKDVHSKDKDNNVIIKKNFTLFDSHIDLFKFLISIPEQNRVFYECISSDRVDIALQKPHFDLDLSSEDFPGINKEYAYLCLQSVLDSIDRVMKNYNIPYIFENNCLVFSSHGKSNGFDKFSFHIIINNFMHEDNIEAKNFYYLVIAELPMEFRFKSFVDGMVYSKFQNFRMLWCQKLSSNRPKLLDPITKCLSYNEDEADNVKKLRLFEASLISFTNGCELLPSFGNKEQIFRYQKQDKITEEQFGHMKYYFTKRSDLVGQYIISGISGNEIRLNRKHGANIKCPIHQRIHQNIGAKLYSMGECYYFYCYGDYKGVGSQNKSMLIGADYMIEVKNNKIIDKFESNVEGGIDDFVDDGEDWDGMIGCYNVFKPEENESSDTEEDDLEKLFVLDDDANIENNISSSSTNVINEVSETKPPKIIENKVLKLITEYLYHDDKCRKRAYLSIDPRINDIKEDFDVKQPNIIPGIYRNDKKINKMILDISEEDVVDSIRKKIRDNTNDVKTEQKEPRLNISVNNTVDKKNAAQSESMEIIKKNSNS